MATNHIRQGRHTPFKRTLRARRLAERRRFKRWIKHQEVRA